MVEEVAKALLDASRRLSTSSASDSSGSSRAGSWGIPFGSSQTELSDQAGSLPKTTGSWFSGIPKRSRTVSEGEGTNSRFDMLGLFSGPGRTFQDQAQGKPTDALGDRQRIRRSSSKDVEEAMAGGLNRVGIYMPPI